MDGDWEKSRKKDETLAEILFLVQRFLSTTSCQKAAEALKAELSDNKLLPRRFDFTGKCHDRDFRDFVTQFGAFLPKNLILRACEQASCLLEEKFPACLPKLRPSFLGVGRQSLCRSRGSISNWPVSKCQALGHGVPLKMPERMQRSPGLIARLRAREYSTGLEKRNVFSCSFFHCLDRSSARILGHLASVFCVAFDTSGEYIFTGADDNLVKIWSAKAGKLLFTLRGSAGEITDLTVSQENSLIAAGSVDKIIRVWSLRNGSPVAVLQGHSAMITSIQFLPYAEEESRYLISTSNDCSVCFWRWNSTTNEFLTTPIKCAERTKPGSQMICSSYSAGGRFVVTGCTDHCVRIYNVSSGGPIKIFEKEAHSDRVDSLEWAHSGLKFVSGSKDGTAKIWKFERQSWTDLLLNAGETRKENGCQSLNSGCAAGRPKPAAVKVTMVAWSRDDSLVVTASSDFLLRLWESNTGSFVRFLKGHTDESYVLEPHPFEPRLLLSAGHDGHLMLWDLQSGTCVKHRRNKMEGRGHGAFFDCRFSPDGTYAAAVDSHGCLTILTQESNETLKRVPEEQFFHTDYRPLVRDINAYAMDEHTQIAPHLLPPPFLVRADGSPYPPETQRRVPGKEKCSDAHLVPYVVAPTDESERVDVESSDIVHVVEGGSAQNQNVVSGDPLPLCTWIKRNIVRHPLLSQNAKSVARRAASGAFEENIYEVEMKRRPLPIVVNERVKTAVTEDEHIPRYLRKRRPPAKLLHSYQTRTNPRPSETVSSEDFVNPESIHSDAGGSSSSGVETGGSSSSSESETSDTDYSEDVAGPSTSTRTSTRRTRLRVRKGEAKEVSEHSELEEEVEDEDGRRRRRRSQSSERKKSASPRRRISPRRGNTGRTRKSLPRSVRQRQTNPSQNSSGDEDNSTPDYLNHFPGWLTAVLPRKFPYFPQIGDRVVYLRQGHEVYLDLVAQRKIYVPSKKMKPRQDLDAEELAVVDQIKYELSPYRLCNLRLAQLNAKTGGRTGLTFHIRYHDMDDVVDFIILKQHYDKSLQHKWKPGDRFQAVIDESWWFGTVEKREAFSDDFPRSHYQCLKVKWDNGEDEQMSPWDLEPFRPSLCPVKNGRSIPADPDHLKELAVYHPSDSDWPDGLEEEERSRRIADAIECLATIDGMEMFLHPVNLNMYPDYSASIAYPVDLGTVKLRLQFRFYRHRSALEFDIRQIALNAKHYNETHSTICRQAIMVHETLSRYIRDSCQDDIMSIYTGLELVSTEDLIRCLGKEVVACDADASLKKKLRPSTSSSLVEDWQMECRSVLERILASDNSSPFRSSDGMPELSDIFDSSLSLTEISTRLNRGHYHNPEEFQTDINNLLQNCRSMATNKRSPVFKKALYLHSFFLDQMSPLMERWKRAQDLSVTRESRKLRKKPRKHEYNTRAQRNRPYPQARPTLTYLPEKKSRGETSKQKEEFQPSTSEEVNRKKTRRTRNTELYDSNQGSVEEPVSDESEVDYSEEEKPPRTRKRMGVRMNGSHSVKTRSGGKRIVTYAESSDEEWSNEQESVVLSKSSRGRVRKLRKYDLS